MNPLHIIAGEEPLLAQQAMDKIRLSLRQAGFTREVYEVDNHFAWDSLEGLTQQGSLFASKRLLELRISHTKALQSGLAALDTYSKNSSPDCVIVAWLQESTAPHTLKNIPQQATTYFYRALNASAFRSWLQAQRCLGAEALDFVARYYEGNVLAAHQLLSQLALQFGNNTPYSLEAVMALAQDEARFDVFQTIDSALAGDTATVIRQLAHLEATGVAPLLVLGAFLKSVREWLQIRHAIQAGASMESALEAAKVWSRRIPLMQKALARHSYASGLQWLSTAARIEVDLKSSESVRGWQQLCHLMCNLSDVEEKIRCV